MLKQSEFIISQLPTSVKLRVIHPLKIRKVNKKLLEELTTYGNHGVDANEYDVFFTYNIHDLWGIKKDGTLMEVQANYSLPVSELIEYLQPISRVS